MANSIWKDFKQHHPCFCKKIVKFIFNCIRDLGINTTKVDLIKGWRRRIHSQFALSIMASATVAMNMMTTTMMLQTMPRRDVPAEAT